VVCPITCYCTNADLQLYTLTGHVNCTKTLYCTMKCTFMVYRISISENTMERLKRYVEGKISPYTARTLGESGRYAYTVEDVIIEMLHKEGY